MNPIHTVYVTAALLAMMSAARAEVDVTFTAPEKYVDASLRREGGASAREVALRTIREQLVALGERYLAPNQTLKIEVLGIDLAGEIEWWHGPYDIRYLRDYTWPKIKLRYTLEENGQTIRSAEETVSDPSYQMSVIVTRSGEVMPHEKAMLARWFRSRFAPG
jgi:hypothetical protein